MIFPLLAKLPQFPICRIFNKHIPKHHDRLFEFTWFLWTAKITSIQCLVYFEFLNIYHVTPQLIAHRGILSTYGRQASWCRNDRMWPCYTLFPTCGWFPLLLCHFSIGFCYLLLIAATNQFFMTETFLDRGTPW